MSILDELYVFLSALYGGIIIGFIYDLYRIFRCVFRPKKIATIIEDLVFWMMISITAVAVLFYSNDGQLRFYPFLGFAAGAIIYNSLLSKPVIRNMIGLLSILKKIFKRLLKPFLKLYNILKYLCSWFKHKCSPFYYRIKRIGRLPKRYWAELKKYSKFILSKK